MKLVRELLEDVQYVTEEKDGQKRLYIEGIFMQSEIVNRNGRKYPKTVMENAVSNYIEERVRNGTAYGELGHPPGPKINEERISHLIESLKWNGNDVVGKALIIEDMPMGKMAAALLRAGGRIAVSSRGLGSLKSGKDNIMEVQDDFRLATAADIVTDPSAPSAFVRGIMEDVEWVYDIAKGTWVESRIEPMRDEMKKMNPRVLEEQKLKFFKSFLDGLVKKQQ